MKVEVVFTGLCSFLNVRDNHGKDMIEPSVILVRTDVTVDQGTAGPAYEEGRNPEDEGPLTSPPAHAHHGHDDNHVDEADDDNDEHEHEHVAFLAYNADEMTTTDGDFEDIAGADGFRMLRLPAGVEIVFDGVTKGKPTVVRSYDLIAKKDEYWPDAKNHWNRQYVPKKGGKPAKAAVAAFMRFGQGFLGGGRLCPLEWSFQDSVGRTLTNQFAEEGLYTFDQADGDVVVRLIDIDDPNEVREIRFTPITGVDPNVIPDQTLFIGNNLEEDIPRYVLRTEAGSYQDGDHFRFLNAVSSLPAGPFPAFGRRVTRAEGEGGGNSSGPCGPHSSNG